jgi:hypothetical protein
LPLFSKFVTRCHRPLAERPNYEKDHLTPPFENIANQAHWQQPCLHLNQIARQKRQRSFLRRIFLDSFIFIDKKGWLWQKLQPQ